MIGSGYQLLSVIGLKHVAVTRFANFDTTQHKVRMVKLHRLASDVGACNDIEHDHSNGRRQMRRTYPITNAAAADARDNDDTNILIVDDDRDSRRLLSEHVKLLGYRPLIASDGDCGLRVTNEIRPKLIILDLSMPVLNGHQVIRQLKSGKITRDIPVIVISANSDIESIVSCVRDGVDDYLTKPVNFQLLAARIDACLQKKRRHELRLHSHRRLKDAHRLIRRQNKELQHANKMINRHLRMCSHELRNHLCAVGVNCEIFLRQASEGRPLKSMVRNRIKTILDSTRHMGKVVNNSLDYQKILHGQVQLNQTRLQLNWLVADTASVYTDIAREKSIEIACELDKTLPNGVGDAIRMRQAIGNYVSNGIKYSPAGTVITLRTRRRDTMIRFEIQDNGPGVAEDERHLLFHEFANISTTPTGNESSTGLGLSIVARLVREQGGNVGADFPAGAGSVFWLEIPAYRDA